MVLNSFRSKALKRGCAFFGGILGGGAQNKAVMFCSGNVIEARLLSFLFSFFFFLVLKMYRSLSQFLSMYKKVMYVCVNVMIIQCY